MEKDPQRYSGHLFVLRTNGTLYDPLRQFVADKEFVKVYIAPMVGAEYNVRTFQILRTKDDVESLVLGRLLCVLKPTKGCERIHICRPANDLPDVETLRQWMDSNFYEDKHQQNYRYLLAEDHRRGVLVGHQPRITRYLAFPTGRGSLR